MPLLRDIAVYNPIAGTLLNSVDGNRVSHAYLFAGPAGTAGMDLAMAFARALLCRQPAAGDACGECRDCRLMVAGSHPDFDRVSPSGASIKIDQLRAVRHKAAYRPYLGGRRVFLMSQADTMTAEAANSLLKTLEEPPAGTVLILVADRPQALLPTILSRCQQYYLRGSGCRLVPEDASEAFQEQRQAVIDMVSGLARAGLMEALNMAEELSASREKAQAMLEMAAIWYRDLLVWQQTGSSGLLHNPDLAALIAAESQQYRTGLLLVIIENIEGTRRKIEANANLRLALEALFLRLAGHIAA